MMGVPNDAIIMVLCSWVEPEVEFLFSSRSNTSIGVNICLENPVVSLIMTKKFNINLIMIMRIFIGIRQLQYKQISD